MTGVESPLLTVAAFLFAGVSGANDGSTVVAMSTRTGTLRPIGALLALAFLVGIGPFVVGTGVAGTLARRLVAFEGTGGRIALLVAVGSALAVVLALTSRGLPTSLTLALVGGIIGAGLGAGLAVSWGTVSGVLLAGLLGPIAAIGVGTVAVALLRRVPRGGSIRHVERLTFLAQCVAYSANDAQKMVAIAAIAAGAASLPVPARPLEQAGIALCFGAGTLFAVRRVALRVGEGMVRVRNVNAAAAELSAATVVLGSAALGMPISTTQASATALIGTGLAVGARRIRWQQVTSVATAWVLTLPLSVGIAAGVSTLVERLR